MANTVSILNTASTFGDWVILSNGLAKENNDIAANNYTKPSGTLYLNDPSLGLQVNSAAIFAGSLQVVGIGSYATIGNNLSVGGQLNLSNTTQSLTVSGRATFNGPIISNASGTALTITNNSVLGGSLTVGGITTLSGTTTMGAGASIVGGLTLTAGNITVGGSQVYTNGASSWNINISGQSTSVTNGVYTNGSYSDPAWITSLANTKIAGLITSSQIATVANTQITGLINSSQLSIGTIVNSITGTTNQITASPGTGNVSLSLPQNIHTVASVQFGSIGVGTAATGTSGEIRATNNITAYYSDDRLKTRLGNIENALAKLMSLNGFKYQANETAQALGYAVIPEIGLSAQEVQAVLPEVVVPAPIDEKYLTIHYERVIPLLVEAIKELKAEVDSLKK